MADEKNWDVIIIGGGPAGYTSAIYASRANLKTLLIEGYAAGGQLMITTDVENFPGYPDLVSGPDMMTDFQKQAGRFGATLRQVDVTKVDIEHGSPFKVWIENEELTARSLILATGANAKYLGIESEQRLKGHGVSACATCDGFFFTGKEVAVVGGGDTAMEEANYLTRMCKHVHVIHRRDEFRASKIMQQRVIENEKVTVHYNKTVEEVLGSPDEGVTGLKLVDTVNGESSELPVEGLFIAIGHKPNTELVNNVLETDEAGYLVAEPGSARTSIPGVFAAGDVRDKIYRQAVTAAGSGCMAAIDAERWLLEQPDPA